jgi:hypothetical protein
LLHKRRVRPDPLFIAAGWSSPVARQAHNLKVAGSNPAPATNLFNGLGLGLTHFFLWASRAPRRTIAKIQILIPPALAGDPRRRGFLCRRGPLLIAVLRKPANIAILSAVAFDDHAGCIVGLDLRPQTTIALMPECARPAASLGHRRYKYRPRDVMRRRASMRSVLHANCCVRCDGQPHDVINRCRASVGDSAKPSLTVLRKERQCGLRNKRSSRDDGAAAHPCHDKGVGLRVCPEMPHLTPAQTALWSVVRFTVPRSLPRVESRAR